MTLIGDLERAFASFVFPNLLPLSILLAIGLAALLVVARRRGWHRVVRRHPLSSVVVLVALLVVAIPVGTYLTAPLVIRTELVEAAPDAVTAAVEASPPASAPPSATPAPSVAVPSPSPSPRASAPRAVATASPAPTASPAQTAAPSPSATATPVPAPSFPVTQAKGTFVGADDFHYGRGRALVIETAPGTFVVRFEKFSVRNGPDLHVFLSPDPDGYGKGAVELGILKATDGSFNYKVPATVDVGDARSVVVWCLTFGVQFAHAELSAD